MTNLKKLSVFLLGFVLLAAFASAQTTFPSTTLSAALDSSSKLVKLTSTTGLAAPSNQIAEGPGNPSGTGTYLLLVDKEVMRVQSVSGSWVTVSRGYAGTKHASHASGATVWSGSASYFATEDPSGSCTLVNLTVNPVVTLKGNVWYCSDSVWTRSNMTDYDTAKYLGTAATGVTAQEQGMGRYHVTTLTFSAVTVGSPAGAADLAFGKLLYTLPAGAVVVKSASMSVGLSNTGGVVTADTPDTGIGTTIGSGVQAVLSGVGAAAENILTGQTSNDVNGTAEVKTVADQTLVIEAAGAHTVYLNVADGWAGADTVKATGTVVLEWVILK